MLTGLRDRPRAFARIFGVCTTWTAAGVLPALLTVLIEPGPVFHVLFGNPLEGMAAPARLLGAGVIINVLSGFNGLALLAQGMHREARWAAAAGLLVTLVACPVLAVASGPVGAAGAVALGMLAYNLICSWSLWRKRQLLPWESSTTIVIACAAAPAIVLALVVQALSIRGWPGPVAILIISQTCAVAAALKRNPLAWTGALGMIRPHPHQDA
jgi:O-antigen/teichoic acid export membrane protein